MRIVNRWTHRRPREHWSIGGFGGGVFEFGIRFDL